MEGAAADVDALLLKVAVLVTCVNNCREGKDKNIR